MADLKNDIDKYLKGELSPAEMHALEKKALSDPFLADALEGAGTVTPVEFEADLHHLQSALRERVGKKEERKVVSLWAWSARIAAGLAVIAVATFIVFQFTQRRQSKTDDLSLQTEKTPPPASPKAEADQPASEEDKITAPAAGDETKRGELKPVQPAPKITQPETTASEPVTAQGHVDEAAPAPEQEAATLAQAEAITEVAPIQPADKDDRAAYSRKEETVDMAPADKMKKAAPSTDGYVFSRKRSADDTKTISADSTVALSEGLQGRAAGVAVTETKPATKTKVITGRVTDDNGEGLPGVNVVVKGSAVGTITDATGDYQITVNESDKLVFNYIGFSSQEADTKQSEVNVAMAVDAAQLSEVVVTGYEARDKEEPSEHLELATPEGGKRAFKQYLEKNLVYPQQAIENNVEGRVTIQFTVESTGLLSDFSVLKGIGAGCDEEVIRLVKQGPRWIPTKRANEAVRDRVKVRMKFVLPKKR